jgi:hypothetical protein
MINLSANYDIDIQNYEEMLCVIPGLYSDQVWLITNLIGSYDGLKEILKHIPRNMMDSIIEEIDF